MTPLLIYEYENMLLGNQSSITSQSFISKYQAEQNAKSILKFAIEKLLRWTPEDCVKRMTPEVIRRMKLQDIISYIPFPVELDRQNDLYYLAFYLYPKKVTFDFHQSVIFTYRKVLASYLEDKKALKATKNDLLIEKISQDIGYYKIVENGQTLKKFPKEYMHETEGQIRAGICLQYMLREFFSFHNIYEIYDFFARTSEVSVYLKQYKLLPICKDLYDSPLEYLHEALPVTQKNDMLYSYYSFLDLFDLKWTKS